MGQKTKFLVDLEKETPALLAHMCVIYQLQKESLEKVALFCKVAFGLCILIGVYKAVASKWARKILGFIYSQAVLHSLLQSMWSGNKRENVRCQKLLF